MQKAGFRIKGLLNSWYGAGYLDQVYEDVEKAAGDAEQMNKKAKKFMMINRRKPFFLMLHYMEVHAPYIPRPDYVKLFTDTVPAPCMNEVLRMINNGEVNVTPKQINDVINIYDGNIRYLDDKISEILGDLDRLGLSDRTVVILTADHGEAFMEHGIISHSLKLYEENLRIPLVVRVPGMAEGKRVAGPAQSVDLLPTVVELFGLEPPPLMQGLSLVPALKGNAMPGLADRDIFAMVTMDSFYYPITLDSEKEKDLKDPGLECQYIMTVIDGPWKYIHYFKTGREELFNLEKDPEERMDLSKQNPEIAAQMREKINAHIEESVEMGGVDIRKELSLPRKQVYARIITDLAPMTIKVKDQLKSLGYIR